MLPQSASENRNAQEDDTDQRQDSRINGLGSDLPRQNALNATGTMVAGLP